MYTIRTDHFFHSIISLLARFFVFMAVCGSYQINAATVGESAPTFSIPAIDGTVVSLDLFHGKVVVLEWINPNSPNVLKYYSKEAMNGVGYIQSLQKKYTHPSTNVIWISIAPQSKQSKDYHSEEEWKRTLSTWGASPTCLIIDDKLRLTELYSISVTPQVCVIDRNGKLVYRGAIDSIRSKTPKEIELISNIQWLQTAIENALKGKPVFTSETIPHGTRIESTEEMAIL